MQKGQGRHSFGLHAEFLQNDFLHAAEVGHGELALADADELVRGRDVTHFLEHFGSDVKTAHADAGHMFGLDLSQQQRNDKNQHLGVLNTQSLAVICDPSYRNEDKV